MVHAILRDKGLLMRVPAVLAASVLGCGSSASPSADTSRAPRQTAARAEERPLLGGSSARAVAASPAIVGEVAPVEHAQQLPFLCAREPAVFDLSDLRATESTPIGFWYAWIYQQSVAHVPGFVIAYTGTASGPAIEARVGAVRVASPGTYAFMNRLSPTLPEPVYVDPADPFHVIGSFGRSPFMTAFGPEEEREGFFISVLRVEGHLDAECRALHDVVVTMVLPRENEGQHFGNATLGQALGPMTVDSDGDGKPDSWSVTMAAPALTAVKFRP